MFKKYWKWEDCLRLPGKDFHKDSQKYNGSFRQCPVVERQMARLHVCLFGICYHTDGYAMLNNRKVSCRRGEYVGTQLRLSEITGIRPGSLSRLIDKLVKLQLISVTHIPGGSRIQVKGYDVFTRIQESKETPKNAPATDAAAQMAEAEKTWADEVCRILLINLINSAYGNIRICTPGRRSRDLCTSVFRICHLAGCSGIEAGDVQRPFVIFHLYGHPHIERPERKGRPGHNRYRNAPIERKAVARGERDRSDQYGHDADTSYG